MGSLAKVSRPLRVVVAVGFGLVTGGCQLILNFDRSLIEAGVDGQFFDGTSGEDAGDAGDATVSDAAADVTSDIVVPDAVADVFFQEAAHDAPHDVTVHETSTTHEAGLDAPKDVGHEAAAKDARPDVVGHPDAAKDAPPG
jgi:hypothetical protein